MVQYYKQFHHFQGRIPEGAECNEYTVQLLCSIPLYYKCICPWVSPNSLQNYIERVSSIYSLRFFTFDQKCSVIHLFWWKIYLLYHYIQLNRDSFINNYLVALYKYIVEWNFKRVLLPFLNLILLSRQKL